MSVVFYLEYTKNDPKTNIWDRNVITYWRYQDSLLQTAPYKLEGERNYKITTNFSYSTGFQWSQESLPREAIIYAAELIIKNTLSSDLSILVATKTDKEVKGVCHLESSINNIHHSDFNAYINSWIREIQLLQWENLTIRLKIKLNFDVIILENQSVVMMQKWIGPFRFTQISKEIQFSVLHLEPQC